MINLIIKNKIIDLFIENLMNLITNNFKPKLKFKLNQFIQELTYYNHDKRSITFYNSNVIGILNETLILIQAEYIKFSYYNKEDFNFFEKWNNEKLKYDIRSISYDKNEITIYNSNEAMAVDLLYVANVITYD